MKIVHQRGELSKSVVAGLFAGIAATVLSMIYNGIYRYYTGFTPSMVINVNTIIFGLTVLITISGVLFYFMHWYLKQGTGLYRLVCIGLTAILAFAVFKMDRSGNAEQATQFRELILGIILITGVCCMWLLPFLFKRDLL